MAGEAALKLEARAYMKSRPDIWYYATMQNGYGKRGVPDDLICYKGLFLAIEYKAPKQHPKVLQSMQLEEIKIAGGAATVAWSMDDIRDLFERGIGTMPDLDVPGAYVKVKYY
jgi:hypothetical protein